MDDLIIKVINQIKSDLFCEDYTALEELLNHVPVQYLEGFLSEEL